MPISLLLVEDDARIRRALSLALQDEGYEIYEAADGENALDQLDSHGAEVDLVLLDVMLPGISGIEVCRSLRSRGDLPIILVTARSDSADVVAGLEAGADDYVTKPVVASELAARIRALLRRARPEGSKTIRAGDLVVDVETEQTHRGGVEIGLTKTEFRLLCEISRASGALVTREELLERIWGYGYFGDSRVLDVHVNRLRNKVEEDSHHPVIILTVRGRGYRVGS